jgi:hypothetical protein
MGWKLLYLLTSGSIFKFKVVAALRTRFTSSAIWAEGANFLESETVIA